MDVQLIEAMTVGALSAVGASSLVLGGARLAFLAWRTSRQRRVDITYYNMLREEYQKSPMAEREASEEMTVCGGCGVSVRIGSSCLGINCPNYKNLNPRVNESLPENYRMLLERNRT